VAELVRTAEATQAELDAALRIDEDEYAAFVAELVRTAEATQAELDAALGIDRSRPGNTP